MELGGGSYPICNMRHLTPKSAKVKIELAYGRVILLSVFDALHTVAENGERKETLIWGPVKSGTCGESTLNRVVFKGRKSR